MCTINLQFRWDTFYEGVTPRELARCNDYKDFQDVEDGSFLFIRVKHKMGEVYIVKSIWYYTSSTKQHGVEKQAI